MGKPRRRFRNIVLVATCGCAIVVAAYHYYTRPARIRQIIEARIQRFVNADVSVGGATFSWLNGVRVTDLSVTRPIARGKEGNDHAAANDDLIFSCPLVRLTHDPYAILLGRLDLTSVVADGALLRIARDASTGATNVADLLNLDDDETHGKLDLPLIELRNARLLVVRREADGAVNVVEDLRMTIRGRHVQHASSVYDIVWGTTGPEKADGHSTVDLKTGVIRNVTGGLPWMSIEAVMIAVNGKYDGAGSWCDLLGLDGRVRATDYDLGRAIDRDGPRSATIELNDVSLSIPINKEEERLPRGDRYLRFDGVNGTITLSQDEIVARFDAHFHGSACSVRISMTSDRERIRTLDDVSFTAHATFDALDLPRRDKDAAPDERRFINRWAKLERFYNDYDPTGPVDLDLRVTKLAGADTPVVVERAALTVRGATASCRFFPYRLTDVYGSVAYTPDGVTLRGIRGRHAAGTVTIDGEFDAPKRSAAGRLTISGRSIPLDGELYRALKDNHRLLWDSFAPEGSIDVDVDLVRDEAPPGQKGLWHKSIDVSLEGVSAQYARVPYPVDDLQGTLTILSDGVLVDVHGRRGAVDVDVAVHGSAAFGPEGVNGLDLIVTARNVPFDPTLYRAIPETVRRSLLAFHAEGRFDLRAVIGLGEGAGGSAYRVDVELHDTNVRHEAFPIQVTGLGGILHIDRERIDIDELTGRLGGASVTIHGHQVLGEGADGTHLTIGFQKLTLNDELRSALGESTRTVLADWEVLGPIDATVVLSRPPVSASADRSASETHPPLPNRRSDVAVFTEIRLDGVSVSHARVPESIEDVHAVIRVDANGARTTGATARYAGADVALDLETTGPRPPRELTARLVAEGLPLSSAVRDLLPEELRARWDRFAPRGKVDLHIATLQMTRDPGGDDPVWTAEGRFDLDDASLNGIDAVGALSGTITFAGIVVDRRGGTTLAGELRMPSAEVYSRDVTGITGTWRLTRTDDGAGRFEIDVSSARVHEGRLSAKLGFDFDKNATQYELTATVLGMSAESLIKAETPRAAEDGEPIDIRGVLDVDLALSGSVSGNENRLGRGTLELRDGRYYRLPLLMAIWNYVNLNVRTPPGGHAFERAAVRFLINGDIMEIEEITLDGPGMTLKGGGRMSIPDRHLDLDLANADPGLWANIPLVGDVIGAASRELVVLRVTGPLSQPTVRAGTFRRLNKEFRRLFKRKSSQPIPSVTSEKP